MKIPADLKHKPVIVSEDYDRIDGRKLSSDAKGLSLGLAQWNERGKVDISAKVWRHTGGKPMICLAVKADGYGHGISAIGREAAAAGVEYLAVATVDDVARVGPLLADIADQFSRKRSS